MAGRMDETILPITQGIKFIRRRRSWKRGAEGIHPGNLSCKSVFWECGSREGDTSWLWPQKRSELDPWFGRKVKLVKKNVKKKKTVKRAKKKSATKAKLKRSKLEEKMAEFGRQVAALEMKARRASADTRQGIEAAIKELQPKAGQVQEKLDQMKSAGAAGWGDIALGIDSAIDELKEAYRKAASRFK